MRITDILKDPRVTISFEIFPPKTSVGIEPVMEAAREIAVLKPDFISVTYGAGGGRARHTAEIAGRLQAESGVPVLAHLTCVTQTKETLKTAVDELSSLGIENILALRGDLPADGIVQKEFPHAVDLVRELRSLGDFCIGGACYPEGHVESPHKADDIRYLKEKVDAGTDFLTTQMFFDNHIFYNFLYRIRDVGIRVPVLPGIMPITSARQLGRSVELSGTMVPERFRAIVDHFGDSPEAMKQAGIVYASEQIIDLLANGINDIHVYSMNKPDVAAGIIANLSAILGRTPSGEESR